MNNQIKRMIREAGKVALARAERLTKCGAIQEGAPHYNKAIVCAALLDTAQDYKPLSQEGKADVENLSHF